VSEPIIATHELTCRFGPTVAVDRLTIDVREGEVFGFLGHNGAGKTTTIRLLNGVLEPTSGAAKVFGLSPIDQGAAIRRRTGVLTETPAHDERLTARENLTFFAALYDVSPNDVRGRVDQLLDEFDLLDRADTRVGTFSKGMRQRLALARLLLHDPALLFLDEPTSGLDPVASRQLRDRITTLSRTRGRTVFLCTHNLGEASEVCDRVAVMAHGRILALGTPRELGLRFASAVEVVIEVDPADVGRAVDVLARIGGAPPLVDRALLTTPRLAPDRVPEIVTALVETGVRVFRVEPKTPTLEDVYFALQPEAAAP
jgi:ABC-2 type transport system ATP-binding protein